MKARHTQLENETLEALARAPLTARELRVALAIIRLTNGYHLTESKVSLKYLIQLTRLPRNHLQATLKRLSKWQVIAYLEDGHIACHGPALWEFPPSTDLGLAPPSPNMGLSQLVPEQRISATPDLGLSQLVPDPDTNADTLKKTLLKKTSKENKKDDVDGQSEPDHPSRSGFDRLTPNGAAEASKKSKKSPDPRVTEVLVAIQQALGYEIPHWAKEAHEVKVALGKGFTSDQILDCWHNMRDWSYWQGKWLPLARVTENLGEFAAGRLREHGLSGRPPARRVEARTDPHDFDEPEGA